MKKPSCKGCKKPLKWWYPSNPIVRCKSCETKRRWRRGDYSERYTPEVRQRHIESLKKFYIKHPEARLRSAVTAARNRSILRSNGPTFIERGLWKYLTTKGHIVIYEVRFGRYVVDFYDPYLHVAYEADGEYWHNKKNDLRRDKYLWKKFGLKVVRYSGSTIRRGQFIPKRRFAFR